jgi:hypothetical protein
MEMVTKNENQCGVCGTIYTSAVAYHSGVRECGRCWDWRKLYGPASRYWEKAIENLFVNEGGSGPDMIDLELWDKWGIKNEVIEALNTLEALRVRYEVINNVDRETRNEVLYNA